MRIECSGCGQAMNVPDERLPAAPKFVVRCPKCQQAITVERPEFAAQVANGGDVPGHAHGSEAAPQPSASEPPKAQPASPPPLAVDVPTGLEPEVFPPGAKVAFLSLSDESWRAGAGESLKGAGFFLSEAGSPGEAVAKLRLNHYDLVVAAQDEQGRAILAEIAAWNGLRRREVNVVLVGAGADSLDPKPAFQHGVNTWLSAADAQKAADLLRQALEAYDLYYLPIRQARAGGK
jgi:predicted Zn finger-like uncharacterized protein